MRPVGGIVERDVGVEHQHRHAAHLRLPHRGLHRRGPGRSTGTVRTPPAGASTGSTGSRAKS